METINKPYFKCDFCNKKQFRKSDMVLHERWCSKNPNNKHKCFEFCKHLVKSEEDYEGIGRYGDDYLGKRTIFTCAVLNQKMYSFIAERKKLPIITDSDEIRMPLECDKYETINSFDYTDFNY